MEKTEVIAFVVGPRIVKAWDVMAVVLADKQWVTSAELKRAVQESTKLRSKTVDNLLSRAYKLGILERLHNRACRRRPQSYRWAGVDYRVEIFVPEGESD